MKRLGLLITTIALCVSAFSLGYFLTDFRLSLYNPVLPGFEKPKQIAQELQSFIFKPQRAPLIGRVLTDPIVAGGDLYYFERNSGKIFSFNIASKKETPISERLFVGFLKARWSQTNLKALVFTSNLKTGAVDLYDPGNKIVRNLANTVNSAVFSPDGTMIAQASVNNGVTEVTVINIATWDQDQIFKTRLTEPEIYWLNLTSLVLVANGGEDDYIIFGLDHEGSVLWSLKTDVAPRILPNPNGKSFIYTDRNEKGETEIYLYDLASKTRASFKLKTLSSKCAWFKEREVLCGVSSSLSGDTLYVAGLEMEPAILGEQFENLIVGKLLYDEISDTIFILNELDGQLYTARKGLGV